MSARESGLWSVDISDAKNPKIISNFATIELATGLDVVGDLAVLGVRVFGVQRVDVSNPAKMKHIAVSNRICKNCRVYDFSDENAPKLLNSYLLTTNPDMPTFWRGKLLLPCGYSGLLLEK